MEFTDGVLRLRAVEPQDAGCLRLWINDPETARYLNMSWPVSTQEQQDWYERLRKDGNRKKLVIESIEGEAIGLLSLMQIDHVNRSVEIGITIGAASQRRKGHALRALRLAEHVLFVEFNFHRIWAEILESNEPCLNLFKQASFEREGVLRESVYWNGRLIGKVIMARLRT